MATFTTFNTLVLDLQNYLERGGSATSDQTVFNQIPRFINGAERKLIQVLKLLGHIEVLSDPVGLNGSVIAKPDRWRQTVSIEFGGGTDSNVRTPIYPRSYEYCRAYWPDDSLTETPRFYADYDINHWLVVPTPNAVYPLSVVAYIMPQLLDVTNQTNFWTSFAPNALLYGALLEAEPFLRDDPRIAVWQNYWTQEVKTLADQDLQRMMDRASQRRTA